MVAIHFHDFSSTLHSLQTFRNERKGRDFSHEIEKMIRSKSTETYTTL